jgi:hypothetical protein
MVSHSSAELGDMPQSGIGSERRWAVKEKELRECATCSVCNRKFGESGLPMFWRVRIERHGVKMDAVRRQSGLTALLGGSAELAMAMGADEEMTLPMMMPVTLTVCEDCCTKDMPIALLAEMGAASAAPVASPVPDRAGH